MATKDMIKKMKMPFSPTEGGNKPKNKDEKMDEDELYASDTGDDGYEGSEEEEAAESDEEEAMEQKLQDYSDEQLQAELDRRSKMKTKKGSTSSDMADQAGHDDQDMGY